MHEMHDMPNMQMMTGTGCCGYPQGCLLETDDCDYKGHPFKARYVYGETDVICNAEAYCPHPHSGQMVVWRCTKKHQFVTGQGDCELVPTKRVA